MAPMMNVSLYIYICGSESNSWGRKRELMGERNIHERRNKGKKGRWGGRREEVVDLSRCPSL